MSKTGVFFGTGFEEVEALTVVDLLRRVDIETCMISVTKEMKVMGSHHIWVDMEEQIEETNFEELDMLILPGGMPGTKNLEACELLMNQLDSFYKLGKGISAICAAPSILGHRKMLVGRTACSFPDFESHLEGAVITGNPVEISDHIITGRGMGCAIDFALAIVATLKDQETADELSKKIIYR